MEKIKIDIPKDKIADFCRRWKVRELSLFGSIIRDDARPDSDIDVLVSFTEDAPWSVFDLIDMSEELETIFGREVDLIEKEALRNPFRRHSILTSKEVIYAV
jgi:predicted nucleotidyltransferase